MGTYGLNPTVSIYDRVATDFSGLFDNANDWLVWGLLALLLIGILFWREGRRRG